jgi:molybdopterin molybdotransferase
MITESEALAQILDAIPKNTASESLPLLETLNRRCAAQQRATIPLPGFDNSMMDGYAVRAADTRDPTPIAVIGTQPAGPDLQLKIEAPRQAIRIFTGAPLPTGCDAVIMQEDVTVIDNSISCTDPVVPGENIRLLGSDLCSGQLLLQPGDLISPGRIGLLASQGLTHLPVYRLPRIAILSTGDELVPPGTAPLLPGQLYNSNGSMIAALLLQLGLPVTELAHSPDSLTDTTSILRRLSEQNDVIILSGGVSVGDKDHVKPALSELGMPPQLWRIKIKPGKPFLFTHRSMPKPLFVFGLPGNPVSTFVTFQLFVRPALLKWCGTPSSDLSPPSASATLTHDLNNPGDRPHYIRGVSQKGQFTAKGLQRSDALFALSKANCLLRINPDSSIKSGENVTIWKL